MFGRHYEICKSTLPTTDVWEWWPEFDTLLRLPYSSFFQSIAEAKKSLLPTLAAKDKGR